MQPSEQVLTARRKADRFEMALSVARLADTYGLAATLYPETPRSRRASVEVRGPRGLKVTVRFDASGANGPDTYVLSWHGVEEGARLDPGMFGNVNPYHGHKATDTAPGFVQLVRILRERFAVIRDDSAFILESS